MDEKHISYVFGIISIVFAFFNPIAGLALGIIGLFENKKEKSKRAKRLNIVGIVLSVIIGATLLYLQFKYVGGTAGVPY